MCHNQSTTEEVALHVDLVVREIMVSEAKWDEIVSATSADPVLQNVVTNSQNGWTQQLPCHPYDAFQDELTVIDGVIVMGSKVVVPSSLQPDKLKRILGIVKYCRRARRHLYWPNMNEDNAAGCQQMWHMSEAQEQRAKGTAETP